MYLLGYDIGSSSIKAALVNVEANGQTFVVQSPQTEMDMKRLTGHGKKTLPVNWRDDFFGNLKICEL